MARGTGVAALFSGPPGTGKSMCAGLIARELDLELYQVDLSQVVSKWVGETEKQLAKLFDAAEEGHALLLFDEADSLFGQRTSDVKGAVDRYANLEVNFLLQRVESFGGITILTTNLDTAIDRALKRRLAAHIVFDAPDDEERARLWERMTRTGAAPLDAGFDPEELARAFPKMTGANIRNAALAAAFLAAADRADVLTQDHLIRAGRVEYRAMGHVLADRRGKVSGPGA
jgi:SpoVK/Ycf46/Vps4 family AAA+-type ATPase